MTDKALRNKRILAIVSVVVVVALVSALALLIWKGFENNISTPEGFKEYIEGFGWKGYLVAVGIQMLQVVVALIPGEVVEIGAGCAFGWLGGTLICLAGVTIASSVVFLLTKRIGIKMVELFVDPAKIDSLKFLNSEKKLKLTVFLLFFIPGTPKDLITYFVGLTRIKLSEFLAISLVARIPSVLSSAIVGHNVIEENYMTSIIVFGVTALVSLAGILIYNKMLSRKQRKTESN
ncbi:MAG: TVP38/TMEM64 family protein [Clostridia bacterium]|nr:TVP38/TMEM64 family protein [Clostridia bacterium]